MPKSEKNPAGGLWSVPHAGHVIPDAGWPHCQHKEKEEAISRRKAGSASAAFLGVRVLELETRIQKRILPIQSHPVEIQQALRVDKDGHIAELKNFVRGSRLRVEPEQIAQARASAALYTQSQSATGDAFPLERLA